MLFRETLTTLPPNLYLAEQIQQGELQCAQDLGIDMYQLMEKAGHAVFDCLLAHFSGAKNIVVLAGGGNNGGDAFVVARLAVQSNMPVAVFNDNPGRKLKGDAEIARQAYLGSGGKLLSFDHLVDLNEVPDVVIDGLLGTGFRGSLRAQMLDIIRLVNGWSAPIIAIDLPSGLDANTGFVESECAKATFTVTFIALKFGLMTGDGPDHVGQLIFAGLGLEAQFMSSISPVCRLLTPKTIVPIPARRLNSNKGTYGHVVCFGGDKGMAGAIFMAAKAALRTGAGKISVFTHPDNVILVNTLCPELMVFSFEPESSQHLVQNKIANCDCVVLGPGLGQSEWSHMLFNLVTACQKQSHNKMVIDADGLNLLAQYYETNGFPSHEHQNWVLTPHPLEAARLLSCSVLKINQQRLDSIEKISERYGAVCVLKGNGSLIHGDRENSLNCSGNPGMASAGMGDVLTGVIAGIIVSRRGLQISLQVNVELAVFLHGLAGDYAAIGGEIGIIATDLIDSLPRAIHDCH